VKQLPAGARIYVSAVVLAGCVLLGLRIPAMSVEQPWLFATLLVLACATAAMKITLPLPAGASTMSVSYAIDFASLLLLGTDQTLIVTAASALCQCVLNVKERPPLHRTLFSIATLVLTVGAAGLTFSQLSAIGGDPITAVARPLLSAATIYFLVNSALVAIAVALSTRQRLLVIWQEHFLWSAPSYLVGAGAAALGAWIVRRGGPWLAPLTFAPVFLTYRTYRVYLGRLEAQHDLQETSDLYLATIEALASAIDAKDQTTRVNLRRVQAYAAGLAEAIGLPSGEVQAVRTGALLHDIGKLAIPAHILAKPGPLTSEEFAKVRIHPQIGAEILSPVPFRYPVVPIVLSHHERWDGSGYPHGLKGEAIPIGARIMAVVDMFDVATSQRSYQTTLSVDGARALLQREAGRALDPLLVDTFIEQLPMLAAAFEASTEPPLLARPSARRASDPHGPPDRNAFENIALAHQEIYALYEIAQTMGTSLNVADTMQLIAAKLAAIIPWSGCALFVQEPESGLLRCRYAAGTDAPLLLNARVRIGDGLSGWVARYRRTLVNAAPAVEFDAAGILTPTATRSAIVCPLELGDRLIGSLALFHLDVDRYSEDHRRLLVRVASQAAAVVSNSVVFEQTEEASLTDPLTGLPNRRSLSSRLASEVSRAERQRTELAVIVLDLDGFKQVNDTHGHAVGDLVLREIARALESTLRPYDLCVRFAGDEFVIVLAGCAPDAAELRRLELQHRVAQIAVAIDATRVRVGASAGVAIYPRDGLNHEALLAVADQRMYTDKSERRRTAHWRGDGSEPASPRAANIARRNQR
jgi:diguanylate cyclase (GGDEF)-like protein/putative nucleotidyltransferase with HDIG domain